MIARTQPAYFASNGNDDAGRFVAQNRRKRAGYLAVREMKVRMADPNRPVYHPDFTRRERSQLDLLDLEWPASCPQDGGFHARMPVSAVNMRSPPAASSGA